MIYRLKNLSITHSFVLAIIAVSVFIVVLDSVHFYLKQREFVQKLRESHSYDDGYVDLIYEEFVTLADIDLSKQKVLVEVVKFPKTYSGGTWQLFNDTFPSLAGIAVGYKDESCVEVYLNIDEWIYMSYMEKKHLIYHELCHDVFNLDHIEGDCNLMSEDMCKLDVDVDAALQELISTPKYQ